MNLRNKLSVPALCCLLWASSGCNDDYLDKNPLNSVSGAVFWTSEPDVQSAVAGVYSRLQQNFLGYERIYMDCLTDNAFMENNTNQPNLSAMVIGNLSPALSGTMVSMYETPYRAIASCNYFLDNVDRAPLAADKLAPYKAEVRFVRAMSYFDLVQSFGGVVMYTSVPKRLEDAKITKSTPEEVYRLIEEDLDYAIANLPDAKYNGHAVKASALGLKARVLLTQEKWDLAVPLLQQVIASGHYGLAPDYKALFTTAGQDNAGINKEILFSTQYLAVSNPQRISPGAAGMDIEVGWYSLIQPYRELIDEYECTDGKPIAESPLYDPAKPYQNRDPRLDMSVKLPGETWKNPTTGAEWTTGYPTFTGFVMEKYVDLSRIPFSNTTATATDQDYIHLRYADILLMFAEAQNEVAGPSAGVYEAIDQVRGRTGVGMPPVDRTLFDTKEKLRDFIRHERRIEFALEGQRYNDLKRWKVAHVKLPTQKVPNGTAMVFETRNYVLPFPQSELFNNPQLKQNEGY